MKVSSSNAHHISFQVGLQIVVVTILNQTFIVNHNLSCNQLELFTPMNICIDTIDIHVLRCSSALCLFADEKK